VIRRFNRYELKYVLPVARANRLIDELAQRLPEDRHSKGNGYRIVSLYYDSPGLDCFWAKVEGLKFRRKVRLRSYAGTDVENIDRGLVEIKQRINRTVQKRRLALPLVQATELCLGRAIPNGLDALDEQVAEEVCYLANSLHLEPTAITAYHRRAFEGTFENAGLRVTFDYDIRGRVSALDITESAHNRLVLPLDWCIMEVKANDTVPDWMTSLLARHDCTLNRVSKYCAVVAALRGIDVDPMVIAGKLPPLGDTTDEGLAASGDGSKPEPQNRTTAGSN
jgi:SPX domain protein involved in polyphosphate accumulation